MATGKANISSEGFIIEPRKESMEVAQDDLQGRTCDTGGRGSKKRSHAAQDIQDLTIESSLKKIKYKLMIMSGKGGVGKSSIAANLAVALSNKGLKTGLLDVDLHGPSIARIMGLSGLLDVVDGKFAEPKVFSENLKVVSMASLMHDENQAIIWRGPAKIGAIRQFISDVNWGSLDCLVIDSPPGTGDEPLTVAQTIPDAKAIVVTTPQEVSLADVRKSINFCKHVNMEILGLIENMGTFACPHCGEPVDLFKKDGGRKTADLLSVPFLGTIPFHQDLVRACDDGKPIMSRKEKSLFYSAFESIANKIAEQLKCL
jgi:ATP-binding protein involved in chromosome partitioning